MPEDLNFDWFIGNVSQVFESLPDFRKPSPALQYKIKDAAVGAFSMFFSQSPSFLSSQKAMELSQSRSNAQSLFGIKQTPTDNQIRNLLDPIAPDIFYPVFSNTFEELESRGYLESYRFFEDCYLLPLDGTEYFRSNKIHCENCSTSHHKSGKISYSHKVLTPVLVAPDNPKVVALEPEFILPQDGAEKQDCELNAAKRWIKRNAYLAEKKIIILGDDLFSREPFCHLLQEKGVHFILVCNPDSHKTLYEWVESLTKTPALESFSTSKWNGRFHEKTMYRYINDLPIKDGDDVLKVNWVEVTVINTESNEIIYKNSFISDFKLDRISVPSIVQSGRSRWKVENENNNVLKTKGYHLEHNYGHGKQFLSATLITLNLLAFLSHTFLEFVDTKYQAIRKALPRRKTFFQDFSTLTKYLLLTVGAT